MRHLTCSAWILASLGLVAPAMAGEAEGPPAEKVEEPATPAEPLAENTCPACPVFPACPTCPPPITVPIESKSHPYYVTDWTRLAELSKEDDRVFSLVDTHAKRLDSAYLIGGIGTTLGGGVAILSVLSRLTSDHWTNATTWGTVGGLSATAFSILMAWTIAPNRDDFYTALNTWNLRHPDRLLAP